MPREILILSPLRPFLTVDLVRATDHLRTVPSAAGALTRREDLDPMDAELFATNALVLATVLIIMARSVLDRPPARRCVQLP